MKCERCGKKEGEYLCSVCNRIICSDCKLIDKGKVYCLDHAPKEVTQAAQKETKPKSFRILKELILTVLILLIGIVIIYYISNFYIAGLLSSVAEQASEIFPELEFVFVLLTYFESAGLYAIITLLIILIALIIVLRLKKRRYKNI